MNEPRKPLLHSDSLARLWKKPANWLTARFLCSRGAIEVQDTNSSPQIDLMEALRFNMNFCKVLQHPGGETMVNRPPLWPIDLRDVPGFASLDELTTETADVEVHFVRDVTIGGKGGSVMKDGRYLYNSSAYPFYCKYYMENGIDRKRWWIEPGREVKIATPVYVISHFNPMYGHWLLEIFPKLFSIAALAKEGVIHPILLPRTMPSFVRATIELVLPGFPILNYDPAVETVRAERVILPSMMHRDYVYHPAFQTALQTFVSPLRPRSEPANIYVSRVMQTGKYRQAGNVHELESAAAGLGLTIVRPEELPWTGQVGMFAAARLVVGEYGSGMHNAIFSPPGARIVCLNIVNNVQSRIANSFGHDVGYLLDPDGLPRMHERTSMKQQHYRIDVKEFKEKVGRLLD